VVGGWEASERRPATSGSHGWPLRQGTRHQAGVHDDDLTVA